jgi:ABC-type branched-subunit amino acid transport system ATPase component
MEAVAMTALQTGYGDIRVIEDATLRVEESEIFVVLGKNGAGKTTLLRAIMGLNRAWAGALMICGHDVTGWRTDRIAKLGVSYAPQDRAFFPDLSVDENLRLGNLHLSDMAYRRRRDDAIRYFPFICNRLHQKVGSLSGGEQSMLKVARAIMAEPRLLLLDEISEGLQPLAIERVKECLEQERRQREFTIVLVEQNVALAGHLANRYALIGAGRISEIGTFESPDAHLRISQHLAI